MSIRMMTTKEAFEKDPTNIEVVEGYSASSGTLYMKTSHIGLVISLREKNGYDDSDFYATVWNEESQKCEEIEYATTRGWTYPNHATVDATPEVLAKVAIFREKEYQQYLAAVAAEEAKRPRVGKTVKVIKGRKLPVDTEGRVFYFDKDQFKSRYADKYVNRGLFASIMGYELYHPDNFCVGIETRDGKRVFMNAGNVVVVSQTSD